MALIVPLIKIHVFLKSNKIISMKSRMKITRRRFSTCGNKRLSFEICEPGDIFAGGTYCSLGHHFVEWKDIWQKKVKEYKLKDGNNLAKLGILLVK